MILALLNLSIFKSILIFNTEELDFKHYAINNRHPIRVITIQKEKYEN